VDRAAVSLGCEALQVRLRAADGYALAATLYSASNERPARQVAVIHGGAGIAASRYRRFASFLADAGIPTLTYDYRGIGASRPASLRGFRAGTEDWAEYDCAAAIAWLRARYPAARIIGIAHSIAALMVGGAHNATEQSRLVMVGGHTGYFRDYAPRYRPLMTALWHGFMPAATFLAGYFPARRFGLGEDLPARMALQWAGRRTPDLRPTVPGFERVQVLLDRCASLQRPALLVTISDDAFATRSGIKRLLSYYPRLFPLQYMEFTPSEAGIRRIGHFGFFSRAAGAALWPRLLAQLEREPV
jgi:predicted alpha/beta hydrolase